VRELWFGGGADAVKAAVPAGSELDDAPGVAAKMLQPQPYDRPAGLQREFSDHSRISIAGSANTSSRPSVSKSWKFSMR